MEIGIPKETKKGEYRVALVPGDVKKIVKAGHVVFVEKNAGLGSGFSDREYRNADAVIRNSVYDCPMIVRVKKPPLDTLHKNQVVMAYLHVEKGQDQILLEKLLNRMIISYAYEEIKDDQGTRLVNLGFEAGLVGMYESFRIYGRLLNESGQINPFKTLPHIHVIGVEEAFSHLAKLQLKSRINVVLMGNGAVSRGVQEVLMQAGMVPTILGRSETLSIEDYLSSADILVNAVLWSPTDSQILKRSMLNLMKKTVVITDISCDRNGAIQTCIPTTWNNATYKVDGVTHFCIDNLPSAIPRESSIHLSKMILPHVLTVVDGGVLKPGIMTLEGKFMYNCPIDAQQRPAHGQCIPA